VVDINNGISKLKEEKKNFPCSRLPTSKFRGNKGNRQSLGNKNYSINYFRPGLSMHKVTGCKLYEKQDSEIVSK
jgi:hypothetical protein